MSTSITTTRKTPMSIIDTTPRTHSTRQERAVTNMVTAMRTVEPVHNTTMRDLLQTETDPVVIATTAAYTGFGSVKNVVPGEIVVASRRIAPWSAYRGLTRTQTLARLHRTVKHRPMSPTTLAHIILVCSMTD